MLPGEKEKHKIQENENTAVLEQLKTHKGKISCKSLISDFVADFGGGGGRKDGRCPYAGQQSPKVIFLWIILVEMLFKADERRNND